MKRRPHWDDELIESLPIPGHSYLEDEDIYAIIAAVEDWIEQQPITQSPQVADADAKIQAVRELCQSARVSISKGCLCHGNECSGTCGRGKPLAWNLNPDDILRILDGDA